MKYRNLYPAVLILAASALSVPAAQADESRFQQTRDGGTYEAGLRNAGIPQSGGMVWPVLNPAQTGKPAVTRVAKR